MQCDVQHARCNIRRAAYSLQRAATRRCAAGETPASASVTTCCIALYRAAPRCIVLQCAAMCSNTAHGRRNSGERRVAAGAERRVSARPRRRPTVIRSGAVTQLSLHGLCRSSDAPCASGEQCCSTLQPDTTRCNPIQRGSHLGFAVRERAAVAVLAHAELHEVPAELRSRAAVLQNRTRCCNAIRRDHRAA